MLSTSHCWNQQSKLVLLKLLKYSLQWCSLSIFSYEKYRILSVSSCQMHKPTTTKKKSQTKTTHHPKKNAPLSLLLEQSSSFIVRYASYKLTFHLSHLYTAYSDGVFFFCLSFIYIYIYISVWITEGEKGMSKVDMDKSMVFLLGFCIFIPTMHNSCLWSRNYSWPLEF